MIYLKKEFMRHLPQNKNKLLVLPDEDYEDEEDFQHEGFNKRINAG